MQRADGHYADVTVAVLGRSGTSVTVGGDAFVWLKDEYGPDAWEWPVCAAWRQSAVEGAKAALAGRELDVVIERIHAHPAHSTPGDVRTAAEQATREALAQGGLQ